MSDDADQSAHTRLLCVGGSDHNLRIPFLKGLQKLGFHVTGAGTGDPQPFVEAGIAYRPFCFDNIVNPLGDWRATEMLARIIAESNPEIVQTFDTKPNLLVPIVARHTAGVRTVRTINGMGWLYSSRAPLAHALRPAYRVLTRITARWVDATVFQNAADQAFFTKHRMTGKRSRLIPGSGVDVTGFARARAASPSPGQLRETLGMGSSEVVITVTRLMREKGIRTLLDAASLIHRVRPEVRFLLAGPRETRGSSAIAQAEIDRHAPYVVWLGRRSDIPALLGLANIFAFPTEYREGIPRVLLEAALAGLPIVTTGLPGCTDVVRDGWNGFLIPQRAPDVLAQRILELLSDQQKARLMGSRGARLVEQEFALDLTVNRYAALYAETLHDKRLNPVRLDGRLMHPKNGIEQASTAR
jgi:glycosyltransferase involved in cell wall biosynthesis